MKHTLIPKRGLSLKILLILIVNSLLLGCNNDDFSDLEKQIEEIKRTPPTNIEPPPEIKTAEPFSFELGDGARDPFQPVPKEEPITTESTTPAANKGIHPDLNRPKEDLELHSLDSLTMAGTLKKDGILWALVQSKEGTIHSVKAGNYMGENNGKITDISENEIKLMEIIPDKEPNQWREQPTSLKLAPTQ
jgi:type IV pilus assembly protein PilP